MQEGVMCETLTDVFMITVDMTFYVRMFEHPPYSSKNLKKTAEFP